MSEYWENVHREDSAHYTTFRCINEQGMPALREQFPDAKADEMNIVMFSTSGVHGTYQTIEEEEAEPGMGITFVIIQPRRVTMLYGVAHPEMSDDFAFLRKLRESSWKMALTIGRNNPESGMDAA